MKEIFPESLDKDKQVHVSSKDKENERFLSLQNGILTLRSDGTWEWSERPE